MPPLALVGIAAAGVALGVVVDRLAKRRIAEVDDFHERETEVDRIPSPPLPWYGS